MSTQDGSAHRPTGECQGCEVCELATELIEERALVTSLAEVYADFRTDDLLADLENFTYTDADRPTAHHKPPA